MTELKVTGTIKEILPIQSGESAKGQWKKVEFVVSNNEGYEGREQLFFFQIFGAEKVDKFTKYNKVGDSVDVKFNIRTNEYKGKYFTNLKAWSVFGLSEKKSEPVEVYPEGEDSEILPF